MATAHNEKTLRLPAFFPDATYATIHSLPMYLIQQKIAGIVVTALHVKLLGLDAILGDFAGFREFAAVPEHMLILSDSGGFQVFSLIAKRGLGKITPDGAVFSKPAEATGRLTLTPELSQEVQHAIKSDLRVTLDIPLAGHEDYRSAARLMELNTEWARRAKERFLNLNGLTEAEFARTSPAARAAACRQQVAIERPLLFAVVQGGGYEDLRRESAVQLAAIGFDGFGFGGWPLDTDGSLNTDILDLFISAIPGRTIAYGMGIGSPDDIARCYQMGYSLFDCVLPTRNARHGYFYAARGCGEAKGERYDVIRINRSQYAADRQPIDPSCDCPVCQQYSRAYLRFLFKHSNPVVNTLATLHNLWWYQNFMERL